MLILNENHVRQCLNMKDCLATNREAFIALAKGHAVVPTRLGLPYNGNNSNGNGNNNSSAATGPSAQDWTLFKPAAAVMSSTQPDSHLMGCKIVSIRNDNPASGLPLVPATILSVNARTGLVDGVLAGTYLTAARTAAGSALATALALRDKPLDHLVLFGAGLQAELHVQAIAEALPQTTLPLLTIINRSQERALSLKNKLLESTELSFQLEKINILRLDDSDAIAKALSTASTVVTTTNTMTPLFDHNIVLPVGCHLNGIGSYTPDMEEIPSRLVAEQCQVWIDTPEARDVGDLKHLTPQHPTELIGNLLAGHSGPSGNDYRIHLPCTFYKAVGTAIQDVMTANTVIKKARELGIGMEVEMS